MRITEHHFQRRREWYRPALVLLLPGEALRAGYGLRCQREVRRP